MDPSNIYMKEQNKLLEALKDISDIGKQRKLLNDFTQKFTTLPIVWHEWLRLEVEKKNDDPKRFTQFANQLRETALSHFFDENFLFARYLDGNVVGVRAPYENNLFCKVIICPYFPKKLYCTRDERLRQLEYDLQYPHRHLEAVFDAFKELSHTFVSPKIKRTFEKNLNLYKNLLSAYENEDVNKWFNLLLETNDFEITIQNMEYYISQKPFHKAAWKIFIQFLKEKDKKTAMLGVCSRYCKLFVDDKEMMKKYENEIMNFKESCENWNGEIEKYIIDFLKIINNHQNYNTSAVFTELISTKENMIESKFKRIWEYFDFINYSNVWFAINKYQNPCNIRIYQRSQTQRYKPKDLPFENELNETIWKKLSIKNQCFSFCPDIIRNISKNYECRQKLYQTCKYFYAKFQTPLCYHMTNAEHTRKVSYIYTKSSMLLAYFKEDDTVFQQMILTTTLNIEKSYNPKFFSYITKTLKDCRIKYLSLYAQNITMNEIKKLNDKNNLISIKLCQCQVFADDNETVITPMEDVITCLSTLKYINIACPSLLFTPFTAQRLANLPGNTKFKKFMLYPIRTPLDAKLICEFLKKYTLPNCLFCFEFNEGGNLQNEFHEIIKDYLQKWEPKHDVPIISRQ